MYTQQYNTHSNNTTTKAQTCLQYSQMIYKDIYVLYLPTTNNNQNTPSLYYQTRIENL